MRMGTKLAATAALLCLSTPSQAATILGQINFTGFVRPMGSTSFATATGLDFYNFPLSPLATNDGGIPGTIFSALGSTGIFAGLICAGYCGTIQDLPSFSTGPITAFFDIGPGIQFDLGTINSVSFAPDGVGGSLKLIASGVFRITGYDPTPAVVTLTTQADGLTSFSATARSAVPEPASWALMIGGFGLAGGMLRASRRRVWVRYANG